MTQAGAGDLQAHDALVIGGGFYGCVIALHLVRAHGLRKVCIVEREGALLTRASYVNQARVHNGYHYPRSYTTAYRSRMNYPRFLAQWPDAIRRDFTKVYAIGRMQSKVTARQYRRFCAEIGVQLEPAPASIRSLFDQRLIDEVFVAEECVFDATVLARHVAADLAEAGVPVLLHTAAVAAQGGAGGSLRVTLRDGAGSVRDVTARLVFNCTYSGLGHLGGDAGGTQTPLKHEITEMALVRPPSELAHLGITVMDGPFFSLMPFPPRALHTLSHVRYTPHCHWEDRPDENPDARFAAYARETRVDRMLRDAVRYLPAIEGCSYVDSLFEVKTLLLKNEGDDGRPILFERHAGLPGYYSVLGGKMDNVYDIMAMIDREIRTVL